MHDYTVPALAGRSISVRPGHAGDSIQFGILSVHGNLIEAVSLDRGQAPALAGALRKASAEADRDLMAALEARQQEASERYKAALARNPWLTLPPEVLKRRGLV